MGVTVYCGCVWGKDFQAKGAASVKALRSLVLGMFRAGSWLAGMLWLVDERRQQEGGGAMRGLWGDRAGGADATDALARIASQLPRAMHANGFLPAVSHLRFSLAAGASPGCSRVPQKSQRVG